MVRLKCESSNKVACGKGNINWMRYGSKHLLNHLQSRLFNWVHKSSSHPNPTFFIVAPLSDNKKVDRPNLQRFWTSLKVGQDLDFHGRDFWWMGRGWYLSMVGSRASDTFEEVTSLLLNLEPNLRTPLLLFLAPILKNAC